MTTKPSPDAGHNCRISVDQNDRGFFDSEPRTEFRFREPYPSEVVNTDWSREHRVLVRLLPDGGFERFTVEPYDGLTYDEAELLSLYVRIKTLGEVLADEGLLREGEVLVFRHRPFEVLDLMPIFPEEVRRPGPRTERPAPPEGLGHRMRPVYEFIAESHTAFFDAA